MGDVELEPFSGGRRDEDDQDCLSDRYDVSQRQGQQAAGGEVGKLVEVRNVIQMEVYGKKDQRNKADHQPDGYCSVALCHQFT